MGMATARGEAVGAHWAGEMAGWAAARAAAAVAEEPAGRREASAAGIGGAHRASMEEGLRVALEALKAEAAQVGRGSAEASEEEAGTEKRRFRTRK